MKQNCKQIRKINTVPNGKAIVAGWIFEILLTVILGIALLPKKESAYMFVFALFFAAMLADSLSKKYWNLIEVSTDGIRHGQDNYLWQDVCLTVRYKKPGFARNAWEYVVFFSDRYLTVEESQSRTVRKNGFYIILTPERTEYLLSFYEKQVRVLNEIPDCRGDRCMMEQIRLHNLEHDDNA